MNWARSLLQQKRPGDGAARANIAVALAGAALRCERVLDAGGSEVAALAIPPLAKALYLRAQCQLGHKKFAAAEADLAAAVPTSPPTPCLTPPLPRGV